MAGSWAGKISGKESALLPGGDQALAKAVAIIRDHRSRLAKELEDPINILVATAADPKTTRSQSQQIISTVGYLLTGVGLGLGFPELSEDQRMPPGTPCSLSVTSNSDGRTHYVALRTRSQDSGRQIDSPALAGGPDKPTPRLHLVESIITHARLNRDQAKKWLADR